MAILYWLVCLVLLVWLLVNNISPMRVGFWAIIAVIAMAGLRGLWVLYADGPLTGARIRSSLMRGLRAWRTRRARSGFGSWRRGSSCWR